MYPTTRTSTRALTWNSTIPPTPSYWASVSYTTKGLPTHPHNEGGGGIGYTLQVARAGVTKNQDGDPYHGR